MTDSFALEDALWNNYWICFQSDYNSTSSDKRNWSGAAPEAHIVISPVAKHRIQLPPQRQGTHAKGVYRTFILATRCLRHFIVQSASPRKYPNWSKKVRPTGEKVILKRTPEAETLKLKTFWLLTPQPTNHDCLYLHFNSYPNSKLKIIDFSQLLFKCYIIILRTIIRNYI